LKTGTFINGRDEKIEMDKKGVLITCYFNYSFTALYDPDENSCGVMNTILFI
jgi:hypothetical protein